MGGEGLRAPSPVPLGDASLIVARHIAFLRAINVGGHTVKMDRLKALFEAIGFANVKTVIASGNVLFDAPAKDSTPSSVSSNGISSRSLATRSTPLSSPSEIAALLSHDPFVRSNHRTSESRLHIGFLKATPAAGVCKVINGCATPSDELHIHGRQLYWS